MSTSVSANRQKDITRWKALVLEYEMKITFLERALAQEESKLRIAEQVSSLWDALYRWYITIFQRSPYLPFGRVCCTYTLLRPTRPDGL